jgi:hypothetical protein
MVTHPDRRRIAVTPGDDTGPVVPALPEAGVA